MYRFDAWWLPDGDTHLPWVMRRVERRVKGRLTYQYHKYEGALPWCRGRRTAVDVGAPLVTARGDTSGAMPRLGRNEAGFGHQLRIQLVVLLLELHPDRHMAPFNSGRHLKGHLVLAGAAVGRSDVTHQRADAAYENLHITQFDMSTQAGTPEHDQLTGPCGLHVKVGMPLTSGSDVICTHRLVGSPI